MRLGLAGFLVLFILVALLAGASLLTIYLVRRAGARPEPPGDDRPGPDGGPVR